MSSGWAVLLVFGLGIGAGIGVMIVMLSLLPVWQDRRVASHDPKPSATNTGDLAERLMPYQATIADEAEGWLKEN